MKKRFVFVVVLGIALVAMALVIPASRYLLVAWIKQEPLEQGRPLSYWTGQLKAGDNASREEAARILGRMGPRAKKAVPALIDAERDPDARVRQAALKALGGIGPEAKVAVPTLLRVYRDAAEAKEMRLAAVAALGKLGPAAAQAVPIMIKTMARDVESAGASQIQMAVTEMGPAAVPNLILLLQDKEPEVRAHAAVALNWIGPGARDAVPALIGALQDEEKSVRQGAAFALLRIGPEAKDAVPALIQALEDQDPEVRRAAALALKELDAGAAAAAVK